MPETWAFLALIIAGSLGITWFAARRVKTVGSFYVAGHAVSPWQNGLAIAGDFLSAAAILGIVGGTALGGLSGFYLGLGTTTTFLLIALIVAEPLRKLGTFTLGDMLTSRFENPYLRGVAALTTFLVSGSFMIAQFVGAGLVLHFLAGIDYQWAVISIGILMTVYVLFGGMLAITLIQVFKMVLLTIVTVLLLALVLAHFSFSPAALMGEALRVNGRGFGTPPHPAALAAKLDYLSFALGLALGPAAMPHILIRFLTVKNARAARTSIVIANWIMSGFLIAVAVLGIAGGAMLSHADIIAANPAGTLVTPMLARALGGPLLLSVFAAVIFATIVAVMAGVSIAAAGTLSHDLWANVLRPRASERERLFVAKVASVLVCVCALLVALGANGLNLAFIGVTGLTIAASANLPAILLTIFWRRFNEAGAITGMLVGLVSALALVALGPTLQGAAAFFPLANAGIVSIPLGFVAAVVGTMLGRPRPDADETFRRMTMRINMVD